jgi:YfiR/HmsC-like
VLENGRIIFEVNREALKEAGIAVSAKLLKLARIVQPANRRSDASRSVGNGTSINRNLE